MAQAQNLTANMAAPRWDSARDMERGDPLSPAENRPISPVPTRVPSLEVPSTTSAFASPAYQTFGSFTSQFKEPGAVSEPSRSASFSGPISHLPFQPVGGYPALWNFRGNLAAGPVPGSPATAPNMQALSMRYPACSANFQVPVSRPIPRPQFGVPTAQGDSGQEGDGPRMVVAMPRIIVVLIVFSFLELLVCAPVSIWFSYYLWVSSTVLFAGPLAAALAMAGVFLVKWGCCGRSEKSIKKFKLLVTMGGVIGIGGAFIVPLIMLGVTCPATQIVSCEYDKKEGAGFALIAAGFMLVHGLLCIVARFTAKSLASSYLLPQLEEETALLEQVGTYQPPIFPGATEPDRFVPNRSFTTPIRHHQ